MGEAVVSSSRLECIRGCQRKYYYNYIEPKIVLQPEKYPANIFAHTGKVAHTAFESFFYKNFKSPESFANSIKHPYLSAFNKCPGIFIPGEQTRQGKEKEDYRQGMMWSYYHALREMTGTFYEQRVHVRDIFLPELKRAEQDVWNEFEKKYGVQLRFIRGKKEIKVSKNNLLSKKQKKELKQEAKQRLEERTKDLFPKIEKRMNFHMFNVPIIAIVDYIGKKNEIVIPYDYKTGKSLNDMNIYQSPIYSRAMKEFYPLFFPEGTHPFLVKLYVREWGKIDEQGKDKGKKIEVPGEEEYIHLQKDLERYYPLMQRWNEAVELLTKETKLARWQGENLMLFEPDEVKKAKTTLDIRNFQPSTNTQCGICDFAERCRKDIEQRNQEIATEKGYDLEHIISMVE